MSRDTSPQGNGGPHAREGKCDRLGIELVRRPLKDLGAEGAAPVMGTSFRHPITGEVRTAGDSSFKDFTLVDLYKRRRLSNSLEQLMTDKYLFRPVALKHRTWLYHDDYRRQLTLESDENAMMRVALANNCIDAPTSAGRWSPVMTLTPFAVGVALTDDMIMLLFSLIIVLFVQLASQWTNSGKWYRHLRPITLLPRSALYLVILARFGMSFGSGNGMNLLGYLVAVIMLVVDLLVGDLAVLRSIQLHARWHMTHRLPGGIFICNRAGAAWYEDVYGDRGIVAEEVSGFSPWQTEQALIMDLEGIIVELRPLQRKEWEIVFDQQVAFGEKVVVLGLDIFTDVLPTAASITEAELKKRQKRR